MMDEKFKEKIIEKLEEMGIDKEMINEHSLWAAKKMMFGIGKMMWIMKENGVPEEEAKEKIKKLVNKIIDSKKFSEMEEMKEHWHEHHEHEHEHSDKDKGSEE
jgi:hypothetical protein